jgi:hypothetical protein
MSISKNETFAAMCIATDRRIVEYCLWPKRLSRKRIYRKRVMRQAKVATQKVVAAMILADLAVVM